MQILTTGPARRGHSYVCLDVSACCIFSACHSFFVQTLHRVWFSFCLKADSFKLRISWWLTLSFVYLKMTLFLKLLPLKHHFSRFHIPFCSSFLSYSFNNIEDITLLFCGFCCVVRKSVSCSSERSFFFFSSQTNFLRFFTFVFSFSIFSFFGFPFYLSFLESFSLLNL